MSGRERAGVNVVVSRVLAAGLAAALGSIGLGLVLAAVRGEALPATATPLSALGAGALAFEPGAWASLGILLLLATPAVRVLVLALSFAREGDRRFAGVSAAVFAILLASLLVGTGR